jgi:hypothetical protein
VGHDVLLVLDQSRSMLADQTAALDDLVGVGIGRLHRVIPQLEGAEHVVYCIEEVIGGWTGAFDKLGRLLDVLLLDRRQRHAVRCGRPDRRRPPDGHVTDGLSHIPVVLEVDYLEPLGNDALVDHAYLAVFVPDRPCLDALLATDDSHGMSSKSFLSVIENGLG